MPKLKMKTKRAAAKRFKFSAGGKVLYKKSQQSSNTPLSKSSRRIKRALRLGGQLEPGDVKVVKKLVPYHNKYR